MNKILLAVAILCAGAGGFLTARQSTTQFEHEANVTREAWLTQTQLVAAAQSDQAGLIEHVRELKQTLKQTQALGENAVWSALQTNGARQFTPELREQLLEELGFNWQSSEEFIMVSKQTLREIQMSAIEGGKLTDVAATVLAMTPEERGQVEAAVQRVQTDFKDWVLAHAERSDPKDDVIAHYSLPDNTIMRQSISNNFVTGIFAALGRERTELIMPSTRNWMISPLGLGLGKYPTTLIIRRYVSGNEQRLNVQVVNSIMTPNQSGGDIYPIDLLQHSFPSAFLPLFPNGWADIAKREGFELPKEFQEKYPPP